MKLPEDYQFQAGIFGLIKARRWANQLEPIVGSPIETLFACAFMTTVDGLDGDVCIVTNDVEMEAASTRFFIYPQKHIGRYRVDFLVGGKGLEPIVVECDGREFHHSTRDQIDRDRARDADLMAQGYRVHRYPGTQITNEEWYVAAIVLSELCPEFFVEWHDRHEGFRR